MVPNYYYYYKVVSKKLDGSPLVRWSGFRTKSLFIIILCSFISKSLSINTSAILLVLIMLTILIRTYRSGLYSKER